MAFPGLQMQKSVTAFGRVVLTSSSESAPEGKGEFVMFAADPGRRSQDLGEYRMMFNTRMNYRNLTPAAAPK